VDTSSRCAFGPYLIEILDFFPRRCAQAQPSLQPVIAQDPRLPLLEGPISAASLARLGDDDPMLLTELLCGASAPREELCNMLLRGLGWWAAQSEKLPTQDAYAISLSYLTSSARA